MQSFLFKIILYVRSMWFCLQHLPARQAIVIPILIGRGVNYKRFKGEIVIQDPIKRAMISLGVNRGTYSLADYNSHILGEGKLIFRGKSLICAGFRFWVSKDGIIEIGRNTFMNANTIMSSNTVISIGDNSSFGWNCSLLDWDGHHILNCSDGEKSNPAKPITLEHCCWLSSHSTITKGVSLCHHTIIPYGAVIFKNNITPYTLFGGSPNKMLKTGIVREDFLNLK